GRVMADDDDSEKTESASERRMGEAADEGQIPLGRELNAVAGFAAGTIALMAVGRPLRDSLIRLVASAAGGLSSPDLPHLAPTRARPLSRTLAACGAAGAAGALAYLGQTQGRIWPHLVLPDLTKVWSGG